jgi:hypothetical protein
MSGKRAGVKVPKVLAKAAGRIARELLSHVNPDASQAPPFSYDSG